MIEPGDRIRINASRLEYYHGKVFDVVWVGTYGKGDENPIAHFYVEPGAATVEKKRGTFAYAHEYEKV